MPTCSGWCKAIRAQDLKPRLWFAPLAAAPGSDLLHDHTDMLLLDKDGAPQNVSWWNSFYLCPAYPKTVDYTRALVRAIHRRLGLSTGLKIDGQHLNGVRAVLQPGAPARQPGGIGRETAGLLPRASTRPP